MAIVSAILDLKPRTLLKSAIGLAFCLAIILLVAKVWSLLATEALFKGDALTWYDLLSSGEWSDKYLTEPTLFLLMSLVGPATFQDYVFYSIVILLLTLLIALRIGRYKVIDQIVILIFCSSSFYGIHFMLNFQRQFLAITLFLVAVLGRGKSLLTRVASLISHRFAILLHLFWELRRLRPTMAALLVLFLMPLSLVGMLVLKVESAESYISYGESSSVHLAMMLLLNICFVLMMLATVQKGDNTWRTLAIGYIACSIPALLWPQMAGAFQRVVYYFIPLLVVLWPKYVRTERAAICRVGLVLYTISTAYVWFRMNFEWFILGVGDRWS